jgi:hypothetical protein
MPSGTVEESAGEAGRAAAPSEASGDLALVESLGHVPSRTLLEDGGPGGMEPAQAIMKPVSAIAFDL